MKEDDLFQKIVQCALWGTNFKSPTVRIDFEGLIEQFKCQSVQGLCCECLIANKNQLELTVDLQRKCLQQAGGIFKRNLKINADVVTLFSFLKQEGFSPVLLKGQGNATFYSNPLNRAPGDIDIYIGENDYDAAKRALCRLVGDENLYKVKKDWENQFDIYYGDTSVELHRSPVVWYDHQKQYGEKLVKQWLDNPEKTDKVTIDGMEIAIPPLQFNVLYLFIHLWNHFMDTGVGLRQLCDWALVLHAAHNRIDLNLLEQDLKALGLLDAWQLMGLVLVRLLGLPQNEFPFYAEEKESKLPLIWDDIQRQGNFGKYGDRTTKSRNIRKGFNRKFFSFYYGIKRYISLLRICPTYVLAAYGRSLRRSLRCVKI